MAAADVEIGDVLLVRPGEVVPLDGVLLSESGSFDESSLTGESLPVERSAGDGLMSGSLNGEAAVRMRVTARMEDSQYSRIVALVQEAADSKAPMVRLADRYAVPFTALAYVLGAVGWIISGSPERFAEVLVVATPCPLLIAAPVAFLGGMSRAAHSGVIVKYAGVLEQLSRIKTAAFDKTGTLTYGRPSLLRIRTAGPLAEDEVLQSGGVRGTVFLACPGRLGDGGRPEPGPALRGRHRSHRIRHPRGPRQVRRPGRGGGQARVRRRVGVRRGGGGAGQRRARHLRRCRRKIRRAPW